MTLATNTSISLRPRSLVQEWVRLFNLADAAGLAAMYTEDATNHQVALTPVIGRANIEAMFRAGFASAKMVCEPENIFEEGDWAILEWRDPLGLRGCGLFHFERGKINFQRGYWDRLTFERLHNIKAKL